MVSQHNQKGGQLARLAAQLCQNPEFQAFCYADGEQRARDFILEVCGVDSRAQLDHDPGAAALFHELVRKPFVEWQRSSER